MARSLGDFRGVYSEIESAGRYCITTPSRSLVIKPGVEPLATNPPTIIVHSAYTIDEPPSGNDLVSTDRSSVVHDPVEGQERIDIGIQSNKPTTFGTIRGCAGNWVCLLVGLTVLTGSITMTVFGFLANDFSLTITSVGNATSKHQRDKVLYDSLSNLKTYGPILTGCGCFIIMCACVLLCDARDKLKDVVETEDTEKDTETLTYSDVLRRIYEDEIRRKDEEETQRMTQKINEYFEYMSRHPIGQRTLLRAMRPRSLSDPCISCTRSESPLPDAYEYAKERLDVRTEAQDKPDNFESRAHSSQPHYDASSSRRKCATPRSRRNISQSEQLLYQERPKLGTPPPIKSRSKNGPIRVDTSSLPRVQGSLEKLYLGDENIIGRNQQKQKKEKRKGKKQEAHGEITKCDNTLPVLTMLDSDGTNTKVDTPSKLKITQEVKESRPHGHRIKKATEKLHEHRHSEPKDIANSVAANVGRDRLLTVAAVSSELQPSIRTLKWVAENNDQPWNSRATADSGQPLNQTTDSSKSDIRKSSTGSLPFDGSNALSLSHQAMVL